MNSNNRRKWIKSAITVVIALVCALVLGTVFYGAMAYQLLGGAAQEEAAADAGALLGLPDAQPVSEQTAQEEMGGTICTVTARLYRTDDGLEIEAVSASPAAYIERLAKEKWTAQLVTGFTLAGMDAVYSVRGGEGMLSSRAGNRIFMLRAPADEQTLYALGANARLD